MWPTTASLRSLGYVAIVAIAFAAGWFGNGWRLNSKHATELRKMQQAGVEALQKRETENAELRKEFLASADAIRAKYRRRVFVCPDPAVPGTDGRPDAGPAGNDRRDPVDIGPALRDCLVTLTEVQRLQRR